MQAESLGKVLPRILFPYVQQWAERSGMTLLSRLLVDEQFRGLLEKYGDDIVTRMAQNGATPAIRNAQGYCASSTPSSETHGGGASANGSDLAHLQDRVLAMEAQQALFEILRAKMRPLALALGCCPDCLVGVEGCPKCWGQSRVAYYPPDETLLEAQVVSPLATRGVPLVLKQKSGSSPRKSTNSRKRSKPWPTK